MVVSFLVGLFLGFIAGIFTTTLCVVAKEADRKEDEEL